MMETKTIEGRKTMTGYQQGILLATGCYIDNRYCVRNIDRWYCEAVEDIYDTKMYGQTLRGKIQYVLKSAKVIPPKLDEITDFEGFCRAWIEIHGILDITNRKTGSGKQVKRLRLRIYGQENILKFVMACLPCKRKKIQYIKNSVQGGYIGETCAIYYQSSLEILDILQYINGTAKNIKIWQEWDKIIEQYRTISNET